MDEDGDDKALGEGIERPAGRKAAKRAKFAASQETKDKQDDPGAAKKAIAESQVERASLMKL